MSKDVKQVERLLRKLKDGKEVKLDSQLYRHKKSMGKKFNYLPTNSKESD